MRVARLLDLILPLGLTLLPACGAGTGPSAATLVLRSLDEPTPVVGEGRAQLVYEIVITNAGFTARTVSRVEVFEGDTQVAAFSAGSLDDLILPGVTLRGRETGILFLWLEVDTADVPAVLTNRVITADDGDGVAFELEVRVNAAAPVVLGPPLRGQDWVSENISNSRHHRRRLVPFDGQLRVPERFAIDWRIVGADGKTFSGDSTLNESYHAYGAEVLAVADGVVDLVIDGVPDNVPPFFPPGPVPRSLRGLAGNVVFLNLGNGQHAVAGHLKPGSLRVQVGESVNKGDVLALVGNSGHSSEPHLHFQVNEFVFDQQRDSVLDAIGLPFVLDSFTIQGGRAVLGDRFLEIPLEGAVIRFPNSP